ncbi:MAG: HEAT repeat domain-containing protein, partial [Planctomycetota bacterium]
MRALRLLPILLLVLLLRPTSTARGDEYEDRLRPGHCPCAEGQACWHYLRSPMRPPADPCRCGLCLAGGNCETKPRPRGTSAACWGSQREECFWKRHAYSWKLQCSQCWADEECDACDEMIGGRDPAVLQTLLDQAEMEGATPRRPLWVVVSPHFYVVTDIHRKLKIPTEGGAPRLATGHEVAHLYAQRCEQAYEDFVHHFGRRVSLGRPMAVYLFEKTSDKEATAAAYLGSPRTDMLYGGGSNRIAGGFAGNGFVGSLQEERNDTNLHGYCRHMVGHILFSCWIIVSGIEKNCPKWAFIGAAHWLEKLLESTEDYATFCSNETTAPTGSTKDWYKKARGLARRRLDPIETFFGRESLGAMSYNDHIRAWSIMDLMLREDRERWLDVLARLRRGDDEGAAFKAGLGITPDEFHTRWVERLTGGRRTMGPVRADADADPEAPGRRERERIETTQEADVLAGLIRGLDVITEVRTARSVVSRMDHPSDLVRETIHLILSRTKDEEVLAYLRDEALVHGKTDMRAGVARVLGEMKHAPAREALESLLEDRNWHVRAEAAWALGRIGDEASLPVLEAALDERTAKTWILIADAVASYGRRSKEATLAIAPRLSDRHWQVRVTAARALARVGTEDGIDALIKRFSLEGGRLHRELYAALKAVTNDDLGKNPETWRKWWEQQKEEHGGLGPQPEISNPADERYGPAERGDPDEPHYYGRRIFSKSVGFVLDTSGSMDKTMNIPERAAQELGGLPTSATRFDLAKGVLRDALERLDPRVRFQLVFFSSEVRPWRSGLVPASPGNVKAAMSAVQNQPASGETNIHGALKAALGLHEQTTLQARLDPIPDTVYFLTDGSPTRGEITVADELLSWFENLNRYGKVQLHVVAMGNLGVDL